MKRFLFFLLLAVPAILCAQTKDPESLKQILQSNAPDTAKFMACINLHNAYFVSDPAQSKAYAQKMLELAKDINNSDQDKYLSKAYIALARCERKARAYDNVIAYGMQVLHYAQKANSKPGILSTSLQLARDYLDADKPAKALPFLTQSGRLATELNDTAQTAKVKQTFGWYYYKTNQNKKAVPYYKGAIETFASLNNAQMVAECKILLVESLLLLGQTAEIPELLFGALETYKKRNSLSRQAYAHGLLGKSYLMNGNADKGLENYLEAKRLFDVSNNDVEGAMAIIDIARSYLAKNDYAACETHAKEAETILTKMDYGYGIIAVKTLWGQYYSEKGNYALAETYFSDAHKMALAQSFADLKLDNEKYWAAHRYRQKNYKGGDSLLYSYAQTTAATKEPEVIANELKTIIGKNKNLDSNTTKILALLYTPGGVDALKKSLGKKGITDFARVDSVLMLNSFSNATAAYDSSRMIAYNQQLLDLETQYKTRQISDSLQLEKQAAVIMKDNLKTRTIILSASVLLLLLVSAGMWLQYKNRKRAEQDRQKIELLQNEIHHRVKNNLAVISRLVEVAGKNSVDNVPLSALKTRIKSIELLHKHLYSGEAGVGKIPLQSYFEDLCIAIAGTYESLKNIRINVNAPVEVDSHIAERLGLILNELVTNSYKYAFSGDTSGSIAINANRQDENTVQLSVADDGAGFESSKAKSSYGMKLIKGLSHELNGTFRFLNTGGTRFVLELPA